MEQNGDILLNTIDIQTMKIATIGSIIFMTLGVLGWYVNGYYRLLIFMCVFAAPFFFLILWWAEYYHKPKYIEIGDVGILLHYRFKSDETVPFYQMRSVLIERGDPDNAIGRFSTRGAIYTKGKFYPILLSADIAERVRDAYRDRAGSMLPDYKAMRR